MQPLRTYIALFRGINVGGKNILPMKELVSLMQQLGFSDVKSYIQTGNVVFRSHHTNSDELGKQISARIKQHFGFAPQILILTQKEMEAAVAANPFPEAVTDGKTLHLFFLISPAQAPQLSRINEIQGPNEQFTLKDQVFYLYAPDGIGRSKLAANIGKLLGVSVTARNWNSACRILEIAHQDN
jgi:uncharacterized protein (DUF1697 family)